MKANMHRDDLILSLKRVNISFEDARLKGQVALIGLSIFGEGGRELPEVLTESLITERQLLTKLMEDIDPLRTDLLGTKTRFFHRNNKCVSFQYAVLFATVIERCMCMLK